VVAAQQRRELLADPFLRVDLLVERAGEFAAGQALGL